MNRSLKHAGKRIDTLRMLRVSALCQARRGYTVSPQSSHSLLHERTFHHDPYPVEPMTRYPKPIALMKSHSNLKHNHTLTAVIVPRGKRSKANSRKARRSNISKVETRGAHGWG